MAYNFLNSPPGPLGGAGQTGTSTQPQTIFSNAKAPFTGPQGLMQGFQGFNPLMQGILSKLPGNMDPQKMQGIQDLFSRIFGGQGGLPTESPQGQGPMGIFDNRVSQQNGPQGPQGDESFNRAGGANPAFGRFGAGALAGVNRPMGMMPMGFGNRPAGPNQAAAQGSNRGGFLSRFMR